MLDTRRGLGRCPIGGERAKIAYIEDEPLGDPDLNASILWELHNRREVNQKFESGQCFAASGINDAITPFMPSARPIQATAAVKCRMLQSTKTRSDNQAGKPCSKSKRMPRTRVLPSSVCAAARGVLPPNSGFAVLSQLSAFSVLPKTSTARSRSESGVEMPNSCSCFQLSGLITLYANTFRAITMVFALALFGQGSSSTQTRRHLPEAQPRDTFNRTSPASTSYACEKHF